MSSDTSSTALTALLDSLHTHLQAQTQLLPTLHAQLGLPTSALEDELTALQAQLAATVDAQLRARREQVEQWTQKCAAVESACGRYCTALGTHVKAAGPSLQEIRKQTVLPRQYELLSSYQEKLRQLYHAKVEHLTTLTNRISTLAITLGPSFFPSDIATPSFASGDATPEPHRDVSPERFARLEKELVRGKAEVNKRLTQLQETFLQIDWLYVELGEQPPGTDHSFSPGSSSPSDSRATSNAEEVFFMSTPTPANRRQPMPSLFASTAGDHSISDEPSERTFERIFAKFSAQLAEAEAAGEELPLGAGLAGVAPTPELRAWAERKQNALQALKVHREAHIQALYDSLEALWRRMGVPEKDMDAFVDANQGSTAATVAAYEEELERMMEYKRERMGEFVANAREEISRLWDGLMVGEEERADFAPFVDDEFSEELLTRHEEEISSLKAELKAKGPLLQNIRKYLDICGEEAELAASAADQSRLMGRGPRDPGRLLREEKMRKRVFKEKPKLEKDLVKSISAWEKSSGRSFLVHGERILDRLGLGTSDPEKEKENSAAPAVAHSNKRKATGGHPTAGSSRAGSAPPRGTTPTAPAPTGYMPKRSTSVAPVIPPQTAQPGPAAKRQRVIEPPATVTRTTRSAAKTPGSAGLTSSVQRGKAASKSPTKQKHRGVLTHTQARVGSGIAKPVSRSIPTPTTTRTTQSARKPKRDSFRPRPSMEDAVFAPTIDVKGAPRWPGIKEEDE